MREPNPHQQDGNWWNDRLGKLTGSRMAGAMNFLKSGKESTERENLRYEIVAERISNTFADKYVTSDMAWGTDQEAAAKEAFENLTGLIVTDVGFIDHPRINFCGVSPDGFVSDGCLIEVKCPKTKTHMRMWPVKASLRNTSPRCCSRALAPARMSGLSRTTPGWARERTCLSKSTARRPEEIAEVEKAAEQFLAECDALFDFFNNNAVYIDKD
jgi:hypothetical protein